MQLITLLLIACATVSTAPDADVGAASPAPPAAAIATTCALGATDTWMACVGQTVRVEGKVPTAVYNHPLSAPMGLPGTPSVVQAYIDVGEGTQVVLLTAEAPDCSGSMVATGTLQHVDLGGAEGTPESYQGWRIDGAVVECR